MTLFDMRKKVLGLIEEMNPDSELLTDDSDIETKINEIINQVMFELCRVKKLPKYCEIEVSKGDLLGFADVEKACGYEVYQLGTVGGVLYSPRAGGTVLKILESGIAEVDCYVYPERITEKTKGKAYEFELTADVLEVMPYGVAGDLLKNDASAKHGDIYATRYEAMKQALDPRYQATTIFIEGGIAV